MEGLLPGRLPHPLINRPRKLTLTTVDRKEQIQQRLHRLNAWVVSASVDELPNEGCCDARLCSDGVIARGACGAQAPLEKLCDGFTVSHGLHTDFGSSMPYRSRYR